MILKRDSFFCILSHSQKPCKSLLRKIQIHEKNKNIPQINTEPEATILTKSRNKDIERCTKIQGDFCNMEIMLSNE